MAIPISLDSTSLPKLMKKTSTSSMDRGSAVQLVSWTTPANQTAGCSPSQTPSETSVSITWLSSPWKISHRWPNWRLITTLAQREAKKSTLVSSLACVERITVEVNSGRANARAPNKLHCPLASQPIHSSVPSPCIFTSNPPFHYHLRLLLYVSYTLHLASVLHWERLHNCIWRFYRWWAILPLFCFKVHILQDEAGPSPQHKQHYPRHILNFNMDDYSLFSWGYHDTCSTDMYPRKAQMRSTCPGLVLR